MKRLMVFFFVGMFFFRIAGGSLYAFPKTVNFSGTIKASNGFLNGAYPVTVRIYGTDDTVLWSEQHSSITFSKGFFSIMIGSVNSESISEEILNHASTLEVQVESETLRLSFSSVMYAFLSENALNASTANVASKALSVDWNNVSGKPSLLTNNFSGTITATAFEGDGSRLTGITAVTTVPNNGITSGKILDGTITNADISDTAAIPFSKLSIVKSDITSLGIPGSDTDTITTNATLLQHRFVSAASPVSGQVLKWDGSSWAPGTDNTEGSTNFTVIASDITPDGSGNNRNVGLSSKQFKNAYFSGTVTANAFSGDGSRLTGIVGTTYSAGSGLHLSGTTFSLAQQSASAGQVLKWSGAAWIPSSDIYTDSIVIGDNSVTSAKIVDGSIVNADISSAAAITFSKLSITKSDITGLDIPGSDTNTTYSAGAGLSLSGTTFGIMSSVVTSNYGGSVRINGAITAMGTVSANAFTGNGSGLTGLTVANDSVTSGKIVDGSIVNADISIAAAIPFSKLNITKSDITGLDIPGSDTNTTYSAGTGLRLSGTTFAITSSVVTSNYEGRLRVNGGITVEGTITANIFVGNGVGLTGITLEDGAVTSAKITDGTITSADISSSAAIPFSKLNITKSDITGLDIPGSDTNTTYSAGTGLSLSGTTFGITSSVVTANYGGSVRVNGSITAIGTVSANTFIGDGSGLTGITLVDDAVTSAKIVDGTITNSDISSAAGITYSKLNLSGSILSTDLADNAVTSAKIANGTITNSDISSTAGIMYSKLYLYNSISNNDLLINSVTSAKIVDGSITNSDINSAAGIPYSKLNLSGSILSTDLADNAVTSAKIAAGTITGTNISSSTSPTFKSLSLINGRLIQKVSTDNYVTDVWQSRTSSGSKILRLMFDGIDSPASAEHFIDFVSSGNSGVNVRGSIYGTSGSVGATFMGIGALDHSSEDAYAFAQESGIVFSSGGADYAEYIRKASFSDVISACEIVGIKNGKV